MPRLPFRPWKLIVLKLFFLKELWKSAIAVVKVVLRRKIDIAPAIIAFPLQLERPLEIALLANLITLTPGTLTVDVSVDRRTLYIHCLDGADPAAIIADIRNGFEAKIREAFA